MLVVEDEPVIAADMASMLKDAGFTVLGPAGDVGHALALLERQGCDAAVLDMNLGRETSEAVARELTRERIPFVVVSGYAKDQLPEALRSAPLVVKPLRRGVVEALLSARS